MQYKSSIRDICITSFFLYQFRMYSRIRNQGNRVQYRDMYSWRPPFLALLAILKTSISAFFRYQDPNFTFPPHKFLEIVYFKASNQQRVKFLSSNWAKIQFTQQQFPFNKVPNLKVVHSRLSPSVQPFSGCTPILNKS